MRRAFLLAALALASWSCGRSFRLAADVVPDATVAVAPDLGPSPVDAGVDAGGPFVFTTCDDPALWATGGEPRVWRNGDACISLLTYPLLLAGAGRADDVEVTCWRVVEADADTGFRVGDRYEVAGAVGLFLSRRGSGHALVEGRVVYRDGRVEARMMERAAAGRRGLDGYRAVSGVEDFVGLGTGRRFFFGPDPARPPFELSWATADASFVAVDSRLSVDGTITHATGAVPSLLYLREDRFGTYLAFRADRGARPDEVRLPAELADARLTLADRGVLNLDTGELTRLTAAPISLFPVFEGFGGPVDERIDDWARRGSTLLRRVGDEVEETPMPGLVGLLRHLGTVYAQIDDRLEPLSGLPAPRPALELPPGATGRVLRVLDDRTLLLENGAFAVMEDGFVALQSTAPDAIPIVGSRLYPAEDAFGGRITDVSHEGAAWAVRRDDGTHDLYLAGGACPGE